MDEIVEPEDLTMDLSKPHISREELTNLLGFKPINLEYYRRALVHKSLQKNVNFMLSLGSVVQEYMKTSFERLEFLGDAVLNLVVTEIIFDKYPNYDEGLLTRIRIKIVRGTNCSNFAKILGLGRFILVSPSISKVKEFGLVINDRILEDAFESLIGAIFKDQGLPHAAYFIKKLVSENIDFDTLMANDDNYKDILMRYTQSFGYDLPIYSHQQENKIFTVKVSLKKDTIIREVGIGTGLTKKDAEQNACKDSICIHNKNVCHNEQCKRIHYDEIISIINREKIGKR